jgi:hypothetical protein
VAAELAQAHAPTGVHFDHDLLVHGFYNNPITLKGA